MDYAQRLILAIERSLALCSFCRSGRWNCVIEGHRILWEALEENRHGVLKPIHGFEH
jgi:hypothetical protein